MNNHRRSSIKCNNGIKEYKGTRSRQSRGGGLTEEIILLNKIIEEKIFPGYRN